MIATGCGWSGYLRNTSGSPSPLVLASAHSDMSSEEGISLDDMNASKEIREISDASASALKNLKRFRSRDEVE